MTQKYNLLFLGLTYNGTQIGIVSFGGDCSDGVPGVMTSVAKYLDWIREKTGI